VERRRSAIRTAGVWETVQGLLAARTAAAGDRPLSVVDLGGGTGELAVRIGELGHSVVVVDPSPDALAALERRAADAGVSGAVRGVLGDAATLRDAASPGTADVVLCHGVLEHVDDPAAVVRAAVAVLVVGGDLSVLAAQLPAAVFARVLAGHPAEARALLHSALLHAETSSADAGPLPRRFTAAGLEALLTDAGCTVTERRGVRVFGDHVASSVDADPDAAAALGALEADVALHPDFLPFAAQLHLLARRR
jgi:SAM-dependent methyltransferase